MRKKLILRATILSSFYGLMVPAFAQDAAEKTIYSANPAYMVAEFKLDKPEVIKSYRDQVEATFKPYSGRFIVRGGIVDSKEGLPPNGRVVITRFDSLAQAKMWYDSQAYQNIIPIRKESGISRVYFVEGLSE